MAANVGLPTPRGTGTSGYVQRNLSHYKPREKFSPYSREAEAKPMRQRQPDQQILEHDRQREVEIRVLELQDRLEDEGVDQEEIDKQVEQLRASLTKNAAAAPTRNSGRERPFKPHQVHEQAEAKIVESEKLRRALGIRPDYQDGDHWNREKDNQGKAS